ncbi:ECF transporter S component [Halocella sp. SP3-1]|uniref:ECF transporter S component n=1 Tax=Halocella sp. SP3-1 TaxID=2382161 RepID=UPI000F75EEC5|nr:ECF transporter S component [Halocella sp. SP3-1]AZO94970.1 ECF transporter S component [Halocella sp. SP3-1]MTI61241.1 ECF transporter S component [Bacillota bacterium]
MKKTAVLPICLVALGAVLNYIGGTIALVLRLPVYLDTIGTIMVGGLLGPIYGIFPGLISGIISGISTDIYALYFTPVQIITGIMSGILFQTVYMKKWMLPLGTLAITIPGTIVSSSITAFLFGGVTSSGSSILVQLLHKFGFNMTVSVFIVQIFTDYLDRFLAVVLVCAVLAAMPVDLKTHIKGEKYSGTL